MNCRLLIRNVSDTYLLENTTSDEKFIFKIYRDNHRKLEEIKAEVELLNLLSSKGARVSYPLKAINGDQIQSFNAAEGIRYGVLFSFAPGEVVYTMDNSQLETLGAEMAKIHQFTTDIKLHHRRKSYNIETTMLRPLRILEFAFNQYDLQEEYNWLKGTATQVIKHLKEFDLEDFSYGYCHFDFFPKNFHFTKNGDITFFDFDFAGEGYLAWDITSFALHPFLQLNYGQMNQLEASQMLETFLTAYTKTKTLTDQEIEAIPYLGFAFWVFYLGFQYESFDDWSNTFFGAKFIKDRIGLIKKWLEYSTGASH
jgi:Ser/Thr protein kinase RdoA (MazF antagonist)